ncbi:hypothetical protein DFH27DRAFT_271123 [Peziza echinospora]|nr:hypothetical protein DFH27DRAFT_271123 [Peziza echinospora]
MCAAPFRQATRPARPRRARASAGWPRTRTRRRTRRRTHCRNRRWPQRHSWRLWGRCMPPRTSPSRRHRSRPYPRTPSSSWPRASNAACPRSSPRAALAAARPRPAPAPAASTAPPAAAAASPAAPARAQASAPHAVPHPLLLDVHYTLSCVLAAKARAEDRLPPAPEEDDDGVVRGDGEIAPPADCEADGDTTRQDGSLGSVTTRVGTATTLWFLPSHKSQDKSAPPPSSSSRSLKAVAAGMWRTLTGRPKPAAVDHHPQQQTHVE